MDREQYDKIGRWFKEHQAQMKADIIRLVRIPSISVPWGENGLSEGASREEAPFGRPCRDCLEEMLAIGQEHGFHTENYGNRVGSIGEREKNWGNMIGFWNHLDVVPAGNGWSYAPFEPVSEGPFLIGRGAQDNKGPAIGMLYVMQCLRELGIKLNHQLCLFVGTDEERGMEDLEYYVRHYPAPGLSLVADSGFPACYGEKGILEGRMYSQEPLSETFLELKGGNAGNMIPDSAYALLEHTEGLEREAVKAAEKLERACSDTGCGITVERTESGLRITARGKGGHSAFPEGSINAVHRLLRFLSGLDPLPPGDRALLERLAFLSEEYYGEHMRIAYEDRMSGRTTCAATVMGMAEGRPFLHFNIRYAITAKPDEMLRKLEEAGRDNGLMWELERDSGPNYFPREHPVVDRLTAVYNEITGSRSESFVMGGGTYARKLPRALAYGVGGMRESEEDRKVREKLFRAGHGGAHQPDECLNLRLLTEAMKIYAMAVIELNDCEV